MRADGEMHDDSIDDERLTRFLLGDVSEGERAAIEERFLADDAYFHHVLVVEDELREAYEAGSLDAADRRRFEERFLVFDDERAKVATMRSLAAELATAGSSGVARRARRSARRNWRAALGAAWQPLSVQLRLSLAGAAALVLALLAWQVADGMRLRSELARVTREAAAREQTVAGQASEARARTDQLAREVDDERRTRARLEQELAQRPQPAPSGRGGPRLVLSLSLTPGRTRATGDTRTLTIPADAAEVRLELDVSEPFASRYEAVVLDADGTEIWRRADVHAAGRLVTLVLPAGPLLDGDYEVTLTAIGAAGGQRQRAGDYYFRVLR